MKNNHLFVMALMMSLPLSLLAEDRVIKGKVVDASTGQPVSGAIVNALGSKSSTLTEDNGEYTLTISESVTSLQVSSPDHNTIILNVRKGEEQKNALLHSNLFDADYTHALESCIETNADHNSYSNAVNIKEEMQEQIGAAAYSRIRNGAPGIGSVMFVQGLNSLNGNAQPLVVVDGVILEQQYGNEMLHQGFSLDVLSNINPSDIKNVTVLRNGTALYGSRGANGVILIETKRSTSMTTKITATGSLGIITEPKYYDMMDAEQYRNYASELLKGVDTRITDFKFLISDPNDKYYYKLYHNNTDWKKNIYRNAISQNYGIYVEGGDDVAMYNMSVGFTNQESTLECNDLQRLNVRINTDINMTEKLSVRFDASFSNIKRDLRDDGAPTTYTEGTPSAPSFMAYTKAPFLNPYSYGNGEFSKTSLDLTHESYLDEALAAYSNYNYRLGNPWAFNKYAEAENKNHHENSLMNLAVIPAFQFNKQWRLSSHFSYSLVNTNNKYYLPINGTPNFYVANIYDTRENLIRSMASKQNSVQSDTRLSWAKAFGDHDVKAFAGVRFNWETYTRNAQLGYDTGSDKTPFMSAALKNSSSEGTNEQWRTIDYYLQAQYNYQNRFLAQANLTLGASSRFGKDAEGGIKMMGASWGLFPSIQGSWIMSNEKWMADVDVIDLLRLTAGYDISGNDGISNDAARSYFASESYISSISGLSFANIGNTELTWEKTGRLNLGVQSMLWGNRIGLDANFFKAKTTNLLSLQSLSFLTGIKENWTNAGEMENTGFDVTLRGKVLAKGDWRWTLGLSVGHYKNEITDLGKRSFIDTELYGATIRTAVGKSANLFYGYKTEGVFATSEEAQKSGLYILDKNGVTKHPFEAGDMIFVDRDDNGRIDENDRFELGDPNPDLYGNIFTNVGWKNFSLDINMNYSLGNDAYNYMRSQLEGGSRFLNQTTAMTQRWRVEGNQTSMPKASFQDPMGNSRFSDRWIEDASYLKLKSVTLSYKLPLNMQFLQGLEFWIQGNNLYTFSKYLGTDPEFACTNAVIGQGIDLGAIGQSRSFVAGVKINL